MDLKALYQSFRAWQKDPFDKEKKKAPKEHVCANCGTTYVGNYCPSCGQFNKIGKVDWRSILEDIKSIIGMDRPHSFISFFVQLFGRPGYMIGDYLNGRRNVYTSPIAMLGIFAAAAIAVGTRTENAPAAWLQSFAEEEGVIGSILGWLASNLSWGVLIQTFLLIFPTWLLFRHSPKHTRHTWPAGIYIQVFMGSLVLICIILRILLCDWVLSLIPIFYFYAYRQLFGYGVWGTLWRTLLSLGSVFFFLGVIIMSILCLSGKQATTLTPAVMITFILVLLVLGAGVMYIGNRIDRKNAN